MREEAEWREVLHDVLAIGGLPTPLEKRWRVWFSARRILSFLRRSSQTKLALRTNSDALDGEDAMDCG